MSGRTIDIGAIAARLSTRIESDSHTAHTLESDPYACEKRDSHTVHTVKSNSYVCAGEDERREENIQTCFYTRKSQKRSYVAYGADLDAECLPLPPALPRLPGESADAWLDRCYAVGGYVSAQVALPPAQDVGGAP
jgi:hypothetical protein